jgi:hypothetical protein
MKRVYPESHAISLRRHRYFPVRVEYQIVHFGTWEMHSTQYCPNLLIRERRRLAVCVESKEADVLNQALSILP